jgi:pimeloyl-ACP methyl ester carboxylesterase
LALEPVARSLATQFQVLVPDLPGNGESDAPASGRSMIEAAADAVEALVDHLGLDGYRLAAVGCGIAIAARLLTRGDRRLGEVIVDADTVMRRTDPQAVAPELPLADDAGHWLAAWMMVRDGQIYAPWYDGRVAAQRHDQGCFDAQWLHDQTCALMDSRANYHRLPREVAASAETTLPTSVRHVPLTLWRPATFIVPS